MVAHDTTRFLFWGESRPKGLGRLLSKNQGFFAHLACAFSTQQQEPMGVLGSFFWIRPEQTKKKKPNHTERLSDPDRESSRWGNLVTQVHQEACAQQQRLIHVRKQPLPK